VVEDNLQDLRNDLDESAPMPVAQLYRRGIADVSLHTPTMK
jgi:hypothetical protein